MKELALKAVVQGKQHVQGVANVLVQFLNLTTLTTKSQQVTQGDMVAESQGRYFTSCQWDLYLGSKVTIPHPSCTE